MELIRKIVSEPPFRLRLFCPDLPEEVERLIAWTIEKQPRHRPADGRILFEAIQRVRHGGTVDTSAGPMLSVLSDYRQAVQRSLAPPQRLASGLTPITETLPPSWRKKCRQAFFAALCTVPILLAGLYYGIRGEGAPDPASLTAQNDPALWFVEDQVAGFQEEAPGITLARINLPGYEISRAGWTGARGTLVAQLDNTSHAHHEGWRTVCAVMPETRQSSIVVPPGLCTPNAKGTPQIAALAFSHDTSPDTALTGRWLAEVESTQPDGAAPVWALALFPTDGTSTAAPLLSLPSGARASTAAMHPDGTRVAAALMGKGAVGRVVEWTLPDTAAPVNERVLESTGAPVHSLCYSPKGERLAILREDSRGNRMLSIVPGSGTVDVHPPVLHGALALGSRPFSADGRLLAVSEAREEGPARILLLSAEDGQIQAELGEGECASWHPTRNALLVVAPDRKSVSQLWELETTPPYRRIQVTHLEHGVRPPCDVSQDGRWGIALSDAAGAPALVFVQLQTASFRLQ
ncbi:MAG: hypothetical protein IT364_13235 [Candidatus Hydrogenedentes bacterium]|nr:hypothetical protein [Candidatus Hydrogenedentota bacterium]